MIKLIFELCRLETGEILALRTKEDIRRIRERVATLSRSRKEAEIEQAKLLSQVADYAEALWSYATGDTYTAEIELPIPTARDKIEIRSRCLEEDIQGRRFFNAEREPLECAIHMLMKPNASWTLRDENGNIMERNEENICSIPIAIIDAIYSEIYPRLYPLQTRIDFLPIPRSALRSEAGSGQTKKQIEQ